MLPIAGRYILRGGLPVPEPDLTAWAEWFEDIENRRVAEDRAAPGVRVSTVFLGLDHDFAGRGVPILWETMVFGGELDGQTRRYGSREEALAGHAELGAEARAAVG